MDDIYTVSVPTIWWEPGWEDYDTEQNANETEYYDWSDDDEDLPF